MKRSKGVHLFALILLLAVGMVGGTSRGFCDDLQGDLASTGEGEKIAEAASLEATPAASLEEPLAEETLQAKEAPAEEGLLENKGKEESLPQ